MMGIISECLRWRKIKRELGYDPDKAIGRSLNKAEKGGCVQIELNENGFRWLMREKPRMTAEAIMAEAIRRISRNRKNIEYGHKPN